LRDRRDLVVVGALWLAVTAIGEVLVEVLAAGAFPLVAAEEGEVADGAILLILRLAVPIFAFVGVVVVYTMLRFRPRGDEAEDSPVQHRSHAGFTWGWVSATSALTVLVIVHPGITGLSEIWELSDAEDPLAVAVTARQWEWRFSYPEQRISDSTELVLPVDRPVRFRLRSEDVVHGFWVPAFRIKEDIVPGETRELVVTPNRTVSSTTSPQARAQCAELCGAGHAEMRSPVRVVSERRFAAWVRERAEGP
jgi:cytochrome c oxidase subunit 2